MRKLYALLALVLVLAIAPAVQSQATLTRTTLSAAITSTSATDFYVASATGFAAGNACYVDQEYMAISQVDSTRIWVIRGSGGTRAATHAASAVVWVGPANYFTTYDRSGACTASNQTVLPLINIANGSFFNCLGSRWIKGVPAPLGGDLLGYSTVPIGSVAYASVGTEVTQVAGTSWFASVWIPHNMIITGVKVLNGATVGTNKWIGALYAGNGGAVLAYSAVAGTTTAGANAFQTLAFTSTYFAVGPARYFICLQGNGTTDKFRAVAASTHVQVLTATASGTFATLAALTAPTTFTADYGPVALVY